MTPVVLNSLKVTLTIKWGTLYQMSHIFVSDVAQEKVTTKIHWKSAASLLDNVLVSVCLWWHNFTKQYTLLCIRVVRYKKFCVCWMSQWDKVLKLESFNSNKRCSFFLYLINFWHNLVYDIQLHFKSFNKMAFVSEIYYKFLQIFSL